MKLKILTSLAVCTFLTACQSPIVSNQTNIGLLDINSSSVYYSIPRVDSIEYDFGIFTWQVPSIQSDYTGYYKQYYSDEKALLLEGSFKNGIPVGKWNYYYKNGSPKIITIYDLEGEKFQETWYYPDGSPQHFVSGKYLYKKTNIFSMVNGENQKTGEYEAVTRVSSTYFSYDEAGNIIYTENNEPKEVYFARIGSEYDFEYKGENLICSAEAFLSKSGKWSVLFYVYPKDKKVLCYEKVKSTALLDTESNKFVNISQTNYYGDFEVLFEIDNYHDSAWLTPKGKNEHLRNLFSSNIRSVIEAKKDNPSSKSE